MPTVAEAFDKFKTRLEPSTAETDDAISRREEVREALEEKFTLIKVFISGSYGRWTKPRPLNDVDLFCVFNKEKEGHYLEKSSRELLDDVGAHLKGKFDRVTVGDNNVTVFFDHATVDEQVLSIDVVPAFEDGKAYKIPDRYHPTGWMKTDPEIHAEKATAANKAFGGHWVSLVKMAKKWNEKQGKPIVPSFLIEVMALKLVAPPFSGGYKYEIKSLLSSFALHITGTWPDPANCGPAVSEEMNAVRCAEALKKLQQSCRDIDQALLLEKQGNVGGALLIWRDKVFGDRFVVS
jgi:hypothetical protein